MREAVSEEQQQTRTAAQAADVDHDSAQRDQQMHRKAMERVSRSITELAISKAADAAAKPVALIETARLRKRPSPSRNGIPSNACAKSRLWHSRGMRKLSKTAAALAIAPLLLATIPFERSHAAPAAKKPDRTWTDPAKAAAEDPDFSIQGEYTGGGAGMQVTALGGGKFYLSKFAGGLPGAGWDGSAPAVQQIDTAGVKKATGADMKRVERSSPTLGAKAPDGATILFGGEANNLVKGEVKDGILWAGAKSTGEFGSFKMHLEFRLPYKPDTPPSSQDRGNSGIYIQNRYEVQVLDSFGLVYDRDQIELPLKSDPKQWCGCLYKFKTADTPMCQPPLTWQTYDIDFTAPKFDGEKKVANARLTVVQNGVKIHDDVELPKGTGMGGTRKEVAEGPIIFQGHGNPIAYRNVWIVPAGK